MFQKGVLALVVSMFTFPAFAELVIYSDRPAARFSGAIEEFTAATGESVTFVEGKYTDLSKRLEQEGVTSPADLIITKDLVYLTDLKRRDFLQSFEESEPVKTVPSFMRASQNEWVAISIRARTIVYSPALLSPSDISTYADLADPKWQGTLCLRTSKASYNEALVGGLIADRGEDEARSIVSGWVNNLAIDPISDDTALLNKIADGTCAVGIVNHYYFAGIKSREPNFPVEIAFADQNEAGVLTNGTGVALLKTATDKVHAQKFMEILLNEKNQLAISGAHFDFPAVENVIPDTFIKEWGPFKKNPVSWEAIGEEIQGARQLMDELGYK